MAQNFYTLRKEAHLLIETGIKYLKANPNMSINIPGLILSFQAEFGFTTTMFYKILQPFIDSQIVIMQGEEIKLANQEVNLIEERPTQSPGQTEGEHDSVDSQDDTITIQGSFEDSQW